MIAVCGVEQFELQVEILVALIGQCYTRLSAQDKAGFVVENVPGVSHRRPVGARFTTYAPLGPRHAGYGRQAEKQQPYRVFAAKTMEGEQGGGIHGSIGLILRQR